MKYFILFIAFGLILTGCAHEAPYNDHEYGMAQMDAFDRQIVHQDYTHAGKTAEGRAGIHAEKIMETYHETYSESFSSEDIDISSTGLSE